MCVRRSGEGLPDSVPAAFSPIPAPSGTPAGSSSFTTSTPLSTHYSVPPSRPRPVPAGGTLASYYVTTPSAPERTGHASLAVQTAPLPSDGRGGKPVVGAASARYGWPLPAFFV